jgi:serine/threonine-protein kinase
MVTLLWLLLNAALVLPARATVTLATASLAEGPLAGSDSVTIAADAPWTATASSWLHLSAANQSGTYSTNVVFTFDANPGPTRAATLNIGGQVLTVTQAGSSYVRATANFHLNSDNSYAHGLALDNAGNLFFTGASATQLKKWSITNNTVSVLVETNQNFYNIFALTADVYGNVYFNAIDVIYRWTASDQIVVQTFYDSPPSRLVEPGGLSMDAAGTSLYISNTGNNQVDYFTGNNILGLCSLNQPEGISMDLNGNIYIAASQDHALEVYSPVTGGLTTLNSALYVPQGVAVDNGGNVLIADQSTTLKEWSAVTKSVVTAISGLGLLNDVVVDKTRDLFWVDDSGNVGARPYAFVDPTPMTVGAVPGLDYLSPLVPSTVNLLPPFNPGTLDSWLHPFATNGTIGFTYSANTGSAPRTGHINVLGVQIAITQTGSTFALSTTNRVEGPSAGLDSVVLAVSTPVGAWSASSGAGWLHVSGANQNGAGSTNIVFSYDANPGLTRVGTLTIAGKTVTVTQAGSTYTQASALLTLATGLVQPTGVAVDTMGNLYVSDASNKTIVEWIATNNTTVTVISSGLSQPGPLALDGAGRLYIGDVDSFGNGYLDKWNPTNNSFSLLATLLAAPGGIAVDGAQNVYISVNNNTIVTNVPGTGTVYRLLPTTSLYQIESPHGLGLDAAGNLYIANTGEPAIRKYQLSPLDLLTITAAGLSQPQGLAVDVAGNIYFTDAGDQKVKVWNVASNQLSTLYSLANQPRCVAVDPYGNVYLAAGNSVAELPYIFVDASSVTMPPGGAGLTAKRILTAGPSSPPFIITSDQSWLYVAGPNDGFVLMTAPANNTGSNRVAHVNLLNQTITVTQGALITVTPPVLTDCTLSSSNTLQFQFTNNQTTAFTVLTATNLSLPLSNWASLGAPVNISPGVFQFTTPVTNGPMRFYRVSSP